MAEDVLNASRVTASKYSPDFSYANQVSGDTFGSLAGYPEFPSAQSFQSPNTGNGFNFGSGILSGLLGGASSILNTIIQNRYNEKQAQLQRDWNESMADKQNQWNLDMWNKQNEYNTPAAQVQRLRDAGLNPLYNSLDGNSAGAAAAAAQPLGYERSNMGPIDNPITAGLQARAAAKDIELRNAQIDKIKEDTHGVELDNEWKDQTMAARVRSEELANELTEEQKKKVGKEIEVLHEEVKKKIAETESEIERKALIEAQKALTKAQENEIIELLPYRILLTQAQTQREKADAALKFVQAAYQRNLIDSGYIDYMAEEMMQRAKEAGYKAEGAAYERDLAAFKSSIKNGTWFSEDGNWLQRNVGKFANGFVSAVSTFSEAFSGLIPLIGAGIVGKGISKSGAATTNVNVPGREVVYSSRGTKLYDADGKPMTTWTYDHGFE